MSRCRSILRLTALLAAVALPSMAEERAQTKLSISPSTLAFSATAGGAAPLPRTVSVRASSRTRFTVTTSVANGGSSWLLVSPSGQFTTNQTLAVSVNPSGLAAGSHSGSISIVSAGVTRTVPVTFTMAPAQLTLSPTALAFSATSGGSAPASQNLSITAAVPTSFTAAATPSWLAVSPSGQFTTNRTLAVSVNPSGLAAGSYSGSISIASAGVTRTVPVTFTLAPAQLTLSPTALAFSATSGGSAPAAQNLSIAAAVPTSFTAAATPSWLAVSPSGQLTTNRTLAVSVNPSGLAAGDYSGSISIVSAGVTRTVPVTFTLAAPATLTLSPTSFSVTATVGGSAPAPQSLSVTASTPLAFTATRRLRATRAG